MSICGRIVGSKVLIKSFKIFLYDAAALGSGGSGDKEGGPTMVGQRVWGHGVRWWEGTRRQSLPLPPMPPVMEVTTGAAYASSPRGYHSGCVGGNYLGAMNGGCIAWAKKSRQILKSFAIVLP